MFRKICSFGPLSLPKACDFAPFFGARGGFSA